MSANEGRVTQSDIKRRAAPVPMLAVVLCLGAAVTAMPVALELDGGELRMTGRVAVADHGSDGISGETDGDRDRDDDREPDNDADADDDDDDEMDDDEHGQSRPNGFVGASKPESRGEAGNDREPVRLTVDRGVARAQFTTRISKRFPANQVRVLEDPQQAVSFFTELVDMQGRTITHRWSYGGVVVYEASSTVSRSKWRFWSTQILPADKAGTWKVEVVDESNTVLQSRQIEYRPTG